MGVVSGYVKETTTFELQTVAAYAGTMDANSGIAIVVPAQKVLDRRKGVFMLLRVLVALSARPLFQVLPNPYDERYRALYDIVEAGARVRYRVDWPEAKLFEL